MRKNIYFSAALMLVSVCAWPQLNTPSQMQGRVLPKQVGRPMELGSNNEDPLMIVKESATPTTITIAAASRKTLEVFYEYGTRPGAYSGKTAITLFQANVVVNVLIDRLKADTQYFYRMRYRGPGSDVFTYSEEHSFKTISGP